MPKFIYAAKDRKSQVSRGIIEAPSREEAIRRIQGQGLFVININPFTEDKGTVPGSPKIAHTHSGVKTEDLAQFGRQASILLASGITLLRTLEIVSVQAESSTLSDILGRVTRNVESGLSLTESLAKYPAYFDAMWVGLIETGEASGNLAGVLDKIASALEMRMEFTRDIVTAIMYPIVLLCAATGALLFFTIFIIPKFYEIFSQFDITLPIATQAMFAISIFLQKNFIFLVLGVIGFIFWFNWYKKTLPGKQTLDRLKLSIPVLKEFFYTASLEKFASEAAILLESGVPIIYALEVTQRSVGNVVLEQILGHVKDKVRGGASLSEQLALTNFFPPMIIEMIKVGEEVGNLPEMFSKISDHYQVQLKTRLKRFVALFEPLMVVFMAFVVGTIVISLFLPLFQLASGGGAR